MRKLALDSSAKWQENKTRGQVGGKERKLDLRLPIYFHCFTYIIMLDNNFKTYGSKIEMIKCLHSNTPIHNCIINDKNLKNKIVK